MDRRMRDLERRAKSGDPRAEVSLLRQRIATHDLRKKKLRLAAYLGHQPAEEVHAEHLRQKTQRFDKWIRGLRHYGGDPAAVRVALSAVGLLLPAWAEVFPDDPQPGRAFALARRLIDEPEEERLQATGEAGQAVAAVLSRERRWGRDSTLRGVEVRQALRAATAVERVARLAVLATQTGPSGSEFSWAYEQSVRLAVHGVGEEKVRRQIQRDLLRWTLA